MERSRQTKKALLWIVNILRKTQIPFQIHGGLAAKNYGSTRELVDIDISIPKKRFLDILPHVKDHILFSPSQFRDRYWDLYTLTLKHRGQIIDICGANVKIFDKTTKRWVALRANFKKSENRKIFGIAVPVIPKKSLIRYKCMLQRRVDKIDVKLMVHNQSSQ